jgi:hypothetical protein
MGSRSARGYFSRIGPVAALPDVLSDFGIPSSRVFAQAGVEKLPTSDIATALQYADLSAFSSLQDIGQNESARVPTRTRGSHHQFVHPTKPGTVTVPHAKKDLGKGLVRAIRKQPGLR